MIDFGYCRYFVFFEPIHTTPFMVLSEDRASSNLSMANNGPSLGETWNQPVLILLALWMCQPLNFQLLSPYQPMMVKLEVISQFWRFTKLPYTCKFEPFFIPVICEFSMFFFQMSMLVRLFLACPSQQRGG